MKIVGAIFEKIKILNFFLSELPLILKIDRKRKTIKKYLQENSYIKDLNEIDQLI